MANDSINKPVYWNLSSVSLVRSLSHFWLFVTPWTAARQAFLAITIYWSWLFHSPLLLSSSGSLDLLHFRTSNLHKYWDSESFWVVNTNTWHENAVLMRAWRLCQPTVPLRPTYLLHFTLWIFISINLRTGFSCSSVGIDSACSTGDSGLVPGLGRSPGEGNDNSLQYPCLEKSLVGCSPWDRKKSGTTEWLTLSYLLNLRTISKGFP